MRLWGGRFGEDNDARVADFTRSIEVDEELAIDDLRGSIAHVRGLDEDARQYVRRELRQFAAAHPAGQLVAPDERREQRGLVVEIARARRETHR